MNGVKDKQKIDAGWKSPAEYIKPAFLIYFSLNLVGLFLYFFFTTNISDLARTEQRDYYDGIDGMTYFCTAVPVLAICFLINLFWVIKALVDIIRWKSFHALFAGASVFILWVADYFFCIYLARVAIQNGIHHFD